MTTVMIVYMTKRWYHLREVKKRHVAFDCKKMCICSLSRKYILGQICIVIKKGIKKHLVRYND